MTRPAGLALLLVLAACASTPEGDERYEPARNVLEVVAVLRRHVPDDTYRFEPARDYTGRNVYRSSLLRLESLEHLHAEALRAGHMDGVLAFARGRALERLRAYDLAAEEYRIAAGRDETLRAEAEWSADVCAALHEATSIGIEPGPDPPPGEAGAEAALARYEERVAKLDRVAADAEGSHYAVVALEETERADAERADYFVARRQLVPQGDVRAVAELQRIATRHAQSKGASRHLLALADLYSDLAVEYVDAHPPEGLRFDPVRFQELIDSASRLYEMVAARDGTPEKLEASRRLEAFLAFALRVDHDRF